MVATLAVVTLTLLATLAAVAPGAAAVDPGVAAADPGVAAGDSATTTGDDSRTVPGGTTVDPTGDAAVSSRPGPGMDDLADAMPALQAARSAPFQPPSTSVSLASQMTLGQEYHDPCGDSPVGDLARLAALDDGPSLAWLWETCRDAPFEGTEDELVMFLIDATPWTTTLTADLVLVQYMDGYVLVLRTLGSDDPDDWVPIAESFGEVEQRDGGVGAGLFLLDASGVDFPTEYRFEVGTLTEDGLADALPKPGHPAPTFPTQCTVVLADRTQVLVAPEDTRQLQRELEADGVQVATASPGLGLLVLDHAGTQRVAALEGDPRVRSVEPVSDRSRPGTDGAGQVVSLADGSRRGADGAGQVVSLADGVDPSWPLEQLRLPTAWERVPSFRTEVAVIDSGIDPTRTGFGNRVGAGYDAVAGRSLPAGRDSAMGDHGTGVSAMVAAAEDGPVRGANPGAVLRPVRLSSHDGCISSDRVALAIEATLDMPGARIVNLSFGGPNLTLAENAAIDRAVAAGKVLVAATGNDGDLFPNEPNYPAAHPDVIGVGASTADRLVAPFSQQAAVDVLAPGTEVVTYGGFGGVIVADGTSLSAPYISGALSLWLAANPVASADSARAALVAAADPVALSIGGGAGIVDVERLLADAGLPGSAVPDDAVRVFDDVDPNSTHGPAIAAIRAAGVTSGFPDGTFRPTEHVRRGQMATFLAGAFDLDVDAAPDPQLSDVALDRTHGTAIAAVIDAGVAGGYPDATFRPDADVTRGQMAAFLAGAMELDLGGDGQRFADAAGTTHAAAIEAIAAAGVTSGFPDGSFRPSAPVTRGQMASFLVAALELS